MAVFLLTCLVALVSVSGAFTAWNLTRLQRRVHDLERELTITKFRLSVLELGIRSESN